MMRNTSNLLAAAAAMLAIGGASPPTTPAARAQVEVVGAGNHTNANAGAVRSAQTAVSERAAWLHGGRSTWRPPGYPRPGDSVRQHARKAARRRNQVRARRAARG